MVLLNRVFIAYRQHLLFCDVKSKAIVPLLAFDILRSLSSAPASDSLTWYLHYDAAVLIFIQRIHRYGSWSGELL